MCLYDHVRLASLIEGQSFQNLVGSSTVEWSLAYPKQLLKPFASLRIEGGSVETRPKLRPLLVEGFKVGVIVLCGRHERVQSF